MPAGEVAALGRADESMAVVPLDRTVGTVQISVVAGADYNVFTRWQNPQGGLSSWVNLGGNVKHNGDTSYLRTATNIYSTDNDEAVRVIGLDGNAWRNVRSGRTGSWSGWSRDRCSDFF